MRGKENIIHPRSFPVQDFSKLLVEKHLVVLLTCWGSFFQHETKRQLWRDGALGHWIRRCSDMQTISSTETIIHFPTWDWCCTSNMRAHYHMVHYCPSRGVAGGVKENSPVTLSVYKKKKKQKGGGCKQVGQEQESRFSIRGHCASTKTNFVSVRSHVR